MRCRTRAQARASGAAPCVCTVCTRGAWRTRPRGLRAGIGLHAGAGQRAATDLHHQVVQRRGADAQHLAAPASAPPSMARPFWLPWQQKGNAPLCQRLAEVAHAGVALLAGLARACDHRGAQRVRGAPAPRARHRAARNLQCPRGGARQHGRGQRGVAATGDRQRRLRSGAVAARAAFDDRQVQQDAHQVARLVRAGHVAGLVLDPHLQPQPLAQRRRAAEGRDGESRGRRPRRWLVQPLHQAHEGGVAPCRARAPHARRTGTSRQRTKGLALSPRSSTASLARRCSSTWSPSPWPRCAQRKGVACVGGWLPAAAGADEDARARVTPRRVLAG